MNQNDFRLHFVKLIQANLKELRALRFEDATTDFEILETYRRTLIAYFECDLETLGSIHADVKVKFKKGLVPEALLVLTKIRLEIRSRKISFGYLQTVAEMEFDPIWSGEVRMIAAYALGEIERFHESKISYVLAVQGLSQIGANHKVLKAKQNLIATDSSINTSLRLIDAYWSLFNDAYKARALGVAGLALINVSREYQLLGMLDVASRFVIRGRALLRYEPGTVQYYLSILYHAHICLDLQKMDEFEFLLNLCRGSRLAEIDGGIHVLEACRDQVPPSKFKLRKGERILEGWGDRLTEDPNRRTSLTDLENQLILNLSRGPMHRIELARKIYGPYLDDEIILDRLKSLLMRLRKRSLDVVEIYSNGMLSLVGNLKKSESALRDPSAEVLATQST